MNVKQIIKTYLEENKFDGLFSPGGECACEISYLLPCMSDYEDCEPGYKAECDCSEGCLWHINKIRPTPDDEKHDALLLAAKVARDAIWSRDFPASTFAEVAALKQLQTAIEQIEGDK